LFTVEAYYLFDYALLTKFNVLVNMDFEIKKEQIKVV